MHIIRTAELSCKSAKMGVKYVKKREKMKEIRTISIKCKTENSLEIAKMTEMQGGLKARSDEDYDKIKL